MAINVSSGGPQAQAPNTPTRSPATPTNTAVANQTPSDSVQLGNSDERAQESTSRPFSSTQGGRLAETVLRPGATSHLERAREELDQARQGEHPNQTRGAEYDATRESNRMYEHERAFAGVEREVAREQDQINQTYERAEERVENGFAPEQRQLERAGDRNAYAERAFEREFSPEVRSQFERYQDIRTRLEAGEFSDGIRPSYEATLRQWGGELRGHGINVDELQTPPGETRLNSQRVANELVQSRQALEEAGDFPRTEEARQAWLGERADERDAALARTETRLETARTELEATRRSVRGEIASERAAENEQLITRLEERLDRERNLDMRDLDPAVRNSEVLRDREFNYADVRVGDDGIEVRQPSWRQGGPTATITAGENGTLEVRSEHGRREGTSTLTPAGEGQYSERSVIREYANADRQGDPRRELTVERNGAGEETLRHEVNRDYDGGVRERTVRREEGTETTLSTRRNAEGEVVYRSERVETEELTTTTTVNSEREGERRTEERVHPDGRRLTTERLDRSDGTTYSRVSTVAEDGTARSHTTDVRLDRNGQEVSTERFSENGTLMRSVRTESIRPDPDVPGLGWIGSHNPQDLVERLGDEDRLTATRTTESVRQPDGSYRDTVSTRLVSGDGNRELVQSQGPHGGNAWEFRQRNGDGTWDSQIFLQGSDDTIVTRNTREGGFNVETRTATTPELAENNQGVPSNQTTVTRTAEAATAAQVNRVLDRHPMSTIRETDAFRQFMEQSGDGTFQVMASESDGRMPDGTRQQGGSFMMEAADGRRLVAMYNQETDTYAVRTEDAQGEPTHFSAVTRTRGGMERLEVNSEGRVEEYRLSQTTGTTRTWLRSAEDVITAPRQLGTAGVQITRAGARALQRFDNALISSRTLNNIDAFGEIFEGGTWARRIGVGAGGLAAGLSALSMSADLASGDIQGAGRHASNLGVDIASITRATTNRALTATNAGLRSNAHWAVKGSRVLGIAGVVAGAGFAAYDVTQGEYVRAGFGAASTAGAALAIFGSSSWAGPVGWGVAGVATIGMLAWDYDQGTRVADYQLR